MISLKSVDTFLVSTGRPQGNSPQQYRIYFKLVVDDLDCDRLYSRRILVGKTWLFTSSFFLFSKFKLIPCMSPPFYGHNILTVSLLLMPSLLHETLSKACSIANIAPQIPLPGRIRSLADNKFNINTKRFILQNCFYSLKEFFISWCEDTCHFFLFSPFVV